MAIASTQHLISRFATANTVAQGGWAWIASDVGMILIDRRVHGHDRRLDRRQVSFQEPSVQADPGYPRWADGRSGTGRR